MDEDISQRITTPSEWHKARAELLSEEKAATQIMANLAAKRRQLPMVQIPNPDKIYFTTDVTETQKSLLDLFEHDKYQQLILYDFMLSDTNENGEGCIGCSFVMDHIANLGHLRSRNTQFVVVAEASIDVVAKFKERMGWKFPFYSCKDTFNSGGNDGDMGKTKEEEEAKTWSKSEGEYFGIAVFLRKGDDVFHTYSTTMRGVEGMLSTYALLDLTALGRQEVGNGILQFKLHDRY